MFSAFFSVLSNLIYNVCSVFKNGFYLCGNLKTHYFSHCTYTKIFTILYYICQWKACYKV